MITLRMTTDVPEDATVEEWVQEWRLEKYG
jgi:hypothetical protein